MSDEIKALVSAEPKLEQVKNKDGSLTTKARRADGRFTASHKEKVKANIKDVMKWLESKVDENGNPSDKTIHQQILHKFHTAMLGATSEDLIGLSKAYVEILKTA